MLFSFPVKIKKNKKKPAEWLKVTESKQSRTSHSNTTSVTSQILSRCVHSWAAGGSRTGLWEVVGMGCGGWLTWSQSTSRHPIPESVSDSRWALVTHHTHVTQRRVGLLFMHKRLYSTFMIFFFFLKKQWRKKVLHILWNQGGLQRVSQAKSAGGKKKHKTKKTN